MTGPRANEVRLSLREHDPAAAATLGEAATSLDEVQAREQAASRMGRLDGAALAPARRTDVRLPARAVPD